MMRHKDPTEDCNVNIRNNSTFNFEMCTNKKSFTTIYYYYATTTNEYYLLLLLFSMATEKSIGGYILRLLLVVLRSKLDVTSNFWRLHEKRLQRFSQLA